LIELQEMSDMVRTNTFHHPEKLLQDDDEAP